MNEVAVVAGMGATHGSSNLDVYSPRVTVAECQVRLQQRSIGYPGLSLSLPLQLVVFL